MELNWKKLNERANFRIYWEPLDSGVIQLILLKLLQCKEEDLDGISFDGSILELSFYKKYRLVNIVLTGRNDHRILNLYVLYAPGRDPLMLDGTSIPVFAANREEELRLSSESGPDYIRFFCFAVRGEFSFNLMEEKPDVFDSKDSEILKLYKPVTFSGNNEGGAVLYEANVAYGSDVFSARFHLKPDGDLDMLDDSLLFRNAPEAALPEFPELQSMEALRSYVSGINKPAHIVLVELLLEKALIQHSGNRLFALFNATRNSMGPLNRFAALLATAFPVISVESQLPFVEEAIAAIVKERSHPLRSFPVLEAEWSLDASDTDSITLDLPQTGPALALVPMQKNPRLHRPDRIAYELSTRNISAIISCESFPALPDCLRSICDVNLILPTIDATTFQTLFERVLGGPLPPDWQKDGDSWVKHVTPVEFEHPLRMKLDAKKSFLFIRNQVMEKLTVIDPETYKGLEDLQGLAEARQFAQDLILDIQSAVRGEIRWSEVDRGALLVGPPGTGKTTLARAIAKDCGIKFVQGSATRWISSGVSLGPHIREIRNTFSEARRYAPSILFIDEIDSLGSRELITNNTDYTTSIINAVLELIQEIEPTAPVFIIAATNSVNRVDPALRRSGRLDRVIHIPLPGSGSLSSIYNHYLTPLREEEGLDKSVDTRTLGGMSVGLTGADVVRIVRGARRRARKENRIVNQKDLIAEVTGKSRSMDGTLRMTPAEIERTAWHEAGHALALFLGKSEGNDIGFVSIIPRSDGTLGFVAHVPEGRLSLTRTEYFEQLEFFLGGRAAEEVRYGKKNISGGASGDLQGASTMAIQMIAQLGLGRSPGLLWIETPGQKEFAQAESILQEAYKSVLKKIRKNRLLLEDLVQELIAQQELTGDQVRHILTGERNRQGVQETQK